MLVITREKGESLMIGSEVEVVIHSIIGGKVRMGIKAPDSLVIKRKEIYGIMRDKDKDVTAL